MSHEIGRRTFMEMLGALPLAGLAGARQRRTDPVSDLALTNLGRGKRIVVLGAGLAGLSAAYNLMRNGYNVIVLEAQGRPGGRVRTARSGFQRGGHAELGAVRIFDSHDHTLKYVRAFGLPLVPYGDTGRRAFYLQGRRFLHPPAGAPWPLDDFNAEERPDPSALFPKYLLSGFDRTGDVVDRAWPGAFPSALGLDRTTLEEYFKAQGATDTWCRWFYAQEGRLGRVNALAALAVEKVTTGDVVRSIQGGNDRLPRAFAQALGDRVKYGSPVLRVIAGRRGVTVNWSDRSGLHEIAADRCVCALPFAPLRRVLLVAPFSAEKRDAIARLQYMAAARCCFQTATRFWKRDPLGELGGLKMIGTDTMAGRIWNTSDGQADSTMGMLQSYMIDTEALAFTSSDRGERVRRLRGLMRDILPGLEPEIVGVRQKAWHEDRWQGGAFGWTQPGEQAWMFPAMRRPEARIHFAGEHTSLWIAWMNGALESGERVVREILDAEPPHS